MKQTNKDIIKEKWKEEFFDKLTKKLEELFPKTNYNNPNIPSKGNRTTALVLNAYANIIFRDILAKVQDEIKKEITEKITNMAISWGDIYDEGKEPEIFKDIDKIIKEIKKI